MKLGTKISLGFASLIVIAVGLGGMAVWNMTNVKQTSTALANESVPEVQVANDLERDVLETMYAARGYAYTDQPRFLDEARSHYAEIEKDLKSAKDLAAKYQMATLRDQADKAQAKAADYLQAVNDTASKIDAMAKDEADSHAALDRFAKACNDYLDSQDKILKDLATKGAAQDAALQNAKGKTLEEAILDRTRKMAMANDIIQFENSIRVETWQAIATRDPKLLEDTAKKFDEVTTKLDQLKAIGFIQANLQQIEDCRTAAKVALASNEKLRTGLLGRAELDKKRGEFGTNILESARAISASALDQTGKSSTAAAASLSTASLTMIIGLGAGVVVGITLAIFITRGITKSITRISSTLASGSEQTSSAAGQVSSSSQSLAQGASEQAAALEETTSALEEMSSMTKKNAETAQQAASLSSEAQKSAAKGNDAMSKMSTAINDIQKSASETAKIIKVIDEIAFQTNLLALNAAVEAARAGEAGKGFAVVAEEVRNLAMRSAEAAKNTSAMIEESVNNAKNGVAIAVEVGKNLEEITTAATKVNSLVGEIAAASKEQAQGIDQVNTAVSQMDKVTQSNAASAEESASAAEELSSQSVQLSDMVGELVALVGSVDKVNAGGHGGGHSGGTPAVRRPASASKSAKTAQSASAGKKASRMIPLDDAESKDEAFAEFSSAK